MARMAARELKAGGTERIGRATIRWEERYMQYTIGGTSVCGIRIYQSARAEEAAYHAEEAHLRRAEGGW